MSGDDEHRSGGLEADTSLDADDGVPDVHIPADAVRSGDRLNLLNGSHFVSELLAVDSNDLTFLELDLDGLGAILCDLFQIRLLRKSLGGVQNLASTDGSAPKADIVGIFKFLEISLEAVLIKVINLKLAGQSHIPCQGDDLYSGSHHKESHVKTDLIVAGASRTVGDGVSANRFRVAGDGHSLEYPLGRDRDRICTVPQHIAEDHITETLVVIFLGHIKGDIFLRTQFVGMLLIVFQLLSAESAGVRTRGVNLIALFLGQVHHREGCVQTAAESDHYFLLFHIH